MVKHAEPIDLDSYINNYFANQGNTVNINEMNQKDFEAVSMQLTKDLYIVQQKEQPIMMNAMLSSCFLFSRKNELTVGQIKKITENIFTYIKQDKKLKTYVYGPPKNFAIKEGALNLNLTIQGNPEDKRNGDKATVDIRKNVGVLDKLSLAYYATQIGVALHREAIIAYSIFYLTQLEPQVNSVKISNIVHTA